MEFLNSQMPGLASVLSGKRLLCLCGAVFFFAPSLYILLRESFLWEMTLSYVDQIELPNRTVVQQPSTSVCHIWPDWRTSAPGHVAVNDSALQPSRLGLAEALGGRKQSCTPAPERLGPFGHSAGKDLYVQKPWNTVKWGAVQKDCAKLHGPKSWARLSSTKLEHTGNTTDARLSSSELDDLRTGRSAVVLRTWDAFQYYDDQMAWMRALATELSLDTGGQYHLFLLVDVKKKSLDLSNNDIYEKILNKSVPEEFRDMALLFNERLLQEWYPKVGEHGAQDQMYQALQIFSYTFPEFDYVWQLEMDARFTWDVAAMLNNADSWSSKQPRKNLWERNGRWFVPGLWQNDYSAFSAQVDAEVGPDQGIWGPPERADWYLDPQGPTPPDRSERDWGIDEAADLITFSPLIDPAGTNWTYEHTIWGFIPRDELPRRMAIVSMTRTSRRLLRLISADQRANGRWVVSESTPETYAFLHGLKAVYVPHLLAFNFRAEMTSEELDVMVHKGPVWSRAGGERAGLLWCGSMIGLPEQRWLNASYFFWAGDAPKVWRDYTNGMCTYPLLLHPVKYG